MTKPAARAAVLAALPEGGTGRAALPPGRRGAALALLRQLRRLDEASGVRHSGIARDVGLLLYEHAERGLTVAQLCSRTGYSGPTVRLVLGRLAEAGAAGAGMRQGKTQLYRLTPQGLAGFEAYVVALSAFAEALAAQDGAFSPAAAPAPAPGPAADPRPPRARYAGAPPGPAAAE